MSNSIILILWILWTIGLLVFYHKIFSVYYFSLFHGLAKELLVAAILGIMMAGVTLYFWWLSAIIIIIFGISMAGKSSNKGWIIASVILAIIISVVGINFKKNAKGDVVKEDTAEEIADIDAIEYTDFQDSEDDILDRWERLPNGDPYIFRYDAEDYYIVANIYPDGYYYNGFNFSCERFDSGNNYSTYELHAGMYPVQDENGSYYGTNGVYYRGDDTDNYCTIYAEADYESKYCKIRIDEYDFEGVLDYVYVEYPEKKDGIDDGIADLEASDPWDFFEDEVNIGKTFRCNCIYEGKEDEYYIFSSYIRGGYSDFKYDFYAKTDKNFGSFFSGDMFSITAIWKDFEVGGKVIIDLIDLQSYGIRDDGSGVNTENNNGNKEGIDFSQWESIYQRNHGPAASIYITSIDENGILFTANIGASGYAAYVDMRDAYAEWIDNQTALYEGNYGYELYIILNDEGYITINDNQENSENLNLSGIYTSESDADFPNCEFVFPNSSNKYISYDECIGLNELECKIARNEIYARHGRKFADESLQAYFNVCSWYVGTIESGDFKEDVLNEYELENLSIITGYEKEMGYR